ncbi:hypothetical protein GBAR_LOCUS13904 [Geodia barretti]|uniref:Uncharacterized protein n=1 Tax=Geodia barretti TaxID=519541 RepID=A0AA35S708_GEOBA|nr:hypothetical protein GBAR_LOCUS13904 [Geodia barretti]
MVMDGSSVITTPGTQTQYSLTVTSQDYDITVRADTCGGSLTGDTSSLYNINLTGNLTSCSALYMYSPVDGSLRAIEVNWTPILRNNPGGPEYTVVIEDGVGSRVRERVGAVNCSSTRCSHTYYPAAGSRGEFGVSVETAGCVTRQTVCLERPVYCSLRDLSPSLVEENRVCGSVSGGGVCYSGDSVGSVAVYFCDDGYSLEGDTTRECLSSGLWNGTTPQCVEIINGCITPQSKMIFYHTLKSTQPPSQREMWERRVCGGSVSQYVLTLTPPTSDCQSSGDCIVMDVITTPGTQTQYSLTVTSQDYDITIRADTCGGSLTGDTSSLYNINLTGNLTSCSALYMYSPVDGSLRAIEVNWTPIPQNNPGGPEYTVVIEDGVGSRVRERVGAVNCSSTQCSHTYYPAASSRGEFGVSVETAGCVTRQTVCLERPVYCSLRDLSPSLVEENRVCGSVSGGGVCYSGDSVGSVAVYFCDDGYSLEGDTTRECLSSGLWNGTTPQCVEAEHGSASAPQSPTVNIAEFNNDGCTLDVSWSEPVISCGGSVSQYVLTVTPPTSDCQSSGDCMVMDGSSVITTPGTQTQYSLTVTSQDYDITVRADTCGGSLTGDTSSLYNINLTGNLTSCSALYMYSPVDGSLRAIEVNWTPIPRNNPGGPEYTVVIEDGVGSRVRERVGAVNCSSTQCSHTYYPAAGSRGRVWSVCGDCWLCD